MDRASFLDAFHQRMETFRRTGKMCDAKLIAKGSDRQGRKNKTTPVEFLVHMSVLSAASAHFEQVFDSGMKESVVGVVELNMDADILEKLIVYMYTGHIQIDADSAPHILPEAAYLQLADLREACAKFLLSNITPSNCLEMWSFACVFSCEEMKELAWKTACENFDAVSTSPHIVQINRESLVLLIEDKRLRCTETSVYTAVINWVRAGTDRKRHLTSLLSHVQLSSLDLKFLSGTVGKEPLIQANTEAFNAFLEALERISSRLAIATPSGRRTGIVADRVARHVALRGNATGSGSHHTSPHIRLNEWTTHDVSSQCISATIAVTTQAIYVVTRKQYETVMFILNLQTGSWENLLPMISTYDFIVASENDLFSFTRRSSVLNKYSHSSRSWSEVILRYGNELQSSLSFVCIASDGSDIYLGDRMALFKCDVHTGECSRLADLPCHLRGLDTYRISATGGDIYVHNTGHQFEYQVEVYHIDRAVWTHGPRMSQHFLVGCEGRLIAYRDSGFFRGLDCYDKGEWKTLSAQPRDYRIDYGRDTMAAHNNILAIVTNERDVSVIALHENSFQPLPNDF